MLETVREFALEQLAASGEEASIRDRHAAWCLALAETAEVRLDYHSDPAWLARLDAELDNLRAALAWFAASGEHTNVLRLLSPIPWYWSARPYHAEVRRWLEPEPARSPQRAGCHPRGGASSSRLHDEFPL